MIKVNSAWPRGCTALVLSSVCTAGYKPMDCCQLSHGTKIIGITNLEKGGEKGVQWGGRNNFYHQRMSIVCLLLLGFFILFDFQACKIGLG